MVTLTFNTFAAKFCERQKCPPENLHKQLMLLLTRYHPDGFMLLECQQLDSSWLGSYVILPYGGSATFKAPPEQPISPRGLGSDMSTVVAVMLASEVPSWRR